MLETLIPVWVNFCDEIATVPLLKSECVLLLQRLSRICIMPFQYVHISPQFASHVEAGVSLDAFDATGHGCSVPQHALAKHRRQWTNEQFRGLQNRP